MGNTQFGSTIPDVFPHQALAGNRDEAFSGIQALAGNPIKAFSGFQALAGNRDEAFSGIQALAGNPIKAFSGIQALAGNPIKAFSGSITGGSPSSAGELSGSYEINTNNGNVGKGTYSFDLKDGT